ncbi:MAG: tRNA uridine-5-carboxymethylaminomethyl(34) synthesis GTPase MnmE [Omnitrophica bacterium RIFCSPHIGHO2_02_FULL_51_18]|nr:MAG: tRNA uridine-5-carboxymethylaminomethyl(34) synthesis GTPase MnmE [Omnitrophica bacterium RIFCSPHIGHO2_02_FULL_51_18]
MVLKDFLDDTIAAISTPLGEGGLGVIRVSGKDAIAIADSIFLSKRRRSVKQQKSYTVQYGHIFSETAQDEKRIIDEVLVLVMRSPKSYTGEDVVEISAHGGAAVLGAILELAIQRGARLAAKGEFTKRAFLNGRMDLLQAETVLDLVQAKTDLVREWASEKLKGKLSLKIEGLKKDLVDILSHLEASIDFPEDFPETHPSTQIGVRLGFLAQEVKSVLKNAEFAIVIKKGLKVVLAGRPNVGKSSLMNELARTHRVIVTPYPGTTRDVVEEEIQIRGIPIRLVDTAGIQETSHPIEKEGIDRTKHAVWEADLVLPVLDGSQPFDGEDRKLLSLIGNKAKIIAVNKSDLPKKLDDSRLTQEFPGVRFVCCSCVQKDGLKQLEEEIFRFINHGQAQMSETPLVNSVRQRDLLSKVFQNIEDAKSACHSNASPELVAVDIRLALDHLGALVGEVVTEDVLEALFSQFCIGK